MNISPLPLSPTFPSRLHWQPACTQGFPFVTEISDAWSVVGSGIGSGSNSLKTAMGEYFERKHFYTDIMVDIKNTLDYSLNPNEVDYFTVAFAQTSLLQHSSDTLQSHTYNLTKTLRVSSLTECYIPTACISLNHYKLEDDNSIYPSKDTCGCSFHWNTEKAVFGSIKECLERQFLTRFWLTGQHMERLDSEHITNLLKHSRSRHLADALNKAGDITAFDICDPAFPGSCIIVFYGQNNEHRHVKYCTGMAYADTTTRGLEKALEELWQTFRFIDLFSSCRGNPNTLNDPYLKHFLNCNTYPCYTEATTTIKMVSPQKKILHPFSLDGLLLSLKGIKIDGYLYIKLTRIGNKTCTFSKYLSPQLFMHMDNSTCINMHNDYSASFKKHIRPERQKIMVPFP